MNLPTMKPFQIILLVVFGLLGLLGLVLFASYNGAGNSPTNVGSVTIWGTLPQEDMDTVLNTIRSNGSDYAGLSYEQHNERTFDTDLAEAIATGNGPDLLLISQEMLVTEQNKLSVIPFSTISQRTYIDTYLPIAELFLAADGTYGIPFAVDPLVMYFNRRTITNAGVATPPTSWEGITSLTERITQTSAGTVAQSTIPFGVYENVESARAIVSALLLQAGSPVSSVGSSGLRGQLSQTRGSGAGALAEPALAFYTQFADPVKTVYTWNRGISSARQMFLSGNLAFYPALASEFPGLKEANPNLDFDMMALPQPQTATQRITYGKVYAFAVPKAAPNASGGVSTALILSDPYFASTISSTLFMAPAIRSALVPENNDRYAPIYYPQALIAKGWLSPSPAETDRIFGTMITNITSGRMGISQALETANQALNAAF
jgi:ABC-type glycerol-3-phosphate transport system substrate-binding protein